MRATASTTRLRTLIRRSEADMWQAQRKVTRMLRTMRKSATRLRIAKHAERTGRLIYGRHSDDTSEGWDL